MTDGLDRLLQSVLKQVAKSPEDQVERMDIVKKVSQAGYERVSRRCLCSPIQELLLVQRVRDAVRSGGITQWTRMASKASP